MLRQTARLRIRQLTFADASFVLDLATDPDWLRYIGDRGICDLDSAKAWIKSGPRSSYRNHGFGLYRLNLLDGNTPVGICGLLQRDSLDSPDLGFALLPAFRGQGYAREAATAIIDQARVAPTEPSRLYAVVTVDNLASRRLLHNLGFVRDGDYRPAGSAAALELYRIDL